MNQINQFVQQLQTLFAGMTAQSKLMAVLLTAGIAISSVFLVQGAVTGNGAMVYLLDGTVFSEEEMMKIEQALGNGGLRGHEVVGNRVKIPKATSDEYYKAITDGKAMPERSGNAQENALNSSGFLDTTKTTEAKHLAAKLKDIGNMIKRMDTTLIQDAFVTYDEKRTGFTGDRKQVASVAIKTRGGRELSGQQRLAIISYVQHSFAGLKQSDIAVYCNNQSTIASDDPIIAQQSRYYQLKAQQEERIKQEAERLLVDYGDVRIGVNVELDPTASEKVESLAFEPKPTKIQSVSSKKDAKSQRAGTGGKPGTETNAYANKPQSISTPEQNSETKEQSESERSVAGNTVKMTETIGLQTKMVSVSIAIPFSYYRKAALFKWKELGKEEKDFKQTENELATLQDEIHKSIQKKISHILPNVAAGADSLPRVSVESYPDMEVTKPTPISISERALEWLSQYWQSLGLMGLVGAALISLRNFAKTVPVSNDRDFERGFDLPLDDANDIDLSSLTDEENEAFAEQSPDTDDNSPPRLRTTGGDIKNDLTAMVRDNPDAAATLLRNWITEAI